MAFMGSDTELYIDGDSTRFQPLFVFMDSQREKEIDLGPDWPYDPMEKDECIINKEIADEFDIKPA